MERIQTPETFDAFAVRTLAESFRIASMIVGDAVDAEEATHDAYLRAARRWHRTRDDDAARRDAWFGRLLLKACRDRVRRHRRVRISDVSHDLRTSATIHPVSEAMARSFERLPLDQRICVVLRYGAEFEPERICAWTRDDERTVAARLREAMRALGVEITSNGTRAFAA